MKVEVTSYFKLLLLFFPDSQKCFERKGQAQAQAAFFTTLLVDWPHHQYYIAEINSDSRGSASNWWVSEKRNAVTLGRAGFIDDELIVLTPWPYRKSRASPGRANTILAPQATPVCLTGHWLISQIFMTMHLSKYFPSNSNHYIVRASRKHFQPFWFVEKTVWQFL